MTKQGPLRCNMQPQTQDVFIQQGFIYINASSAIGIHGSWGVFVFTYIFRSVRRRKKWNLNAVIYCSRGCSTKVLYLTNSLWWYTVYVHCSEDQSNWWNVGHPSKSKIFHREVNADDGGFYRRNVCWNFCQSAHYICRVSWTFHVHLWDQPGKWTTGLFSAKFMEKCEAWA